MSAGVVLATFLLVGVAEFPDKTMIATLVMGSRQRPVFVWIGASLAFTIHVTLAVIAGRLITLLPHRAVEIVVTFLFAAGALYLLLVPEREEIEKGAAEAGAEPDASTTGRPLRVIATAFGVILVGEIGDLTQLLTVNLVAHYKEPYAVFVGALAALLTVSAIGAFGGRAIVRWVPVTVVRRVGGIALLGFAAYNIYSLVS